MLNINLYNNYNLSLAEIHKQRMLDVKIDIGQTKLKSNKKKTGLLAAIGGAVFVIIISAVIIKVFLIEDPVPVVVPTPPPDEFKLTLPQTEYVTINVFELTDEPVSQRLSAQHPNTQKNTVQEKQTGTTVVAQNTSTNKPQQSTAKTPAQYSLEIEGVTESEKNRLQYLLNARKIKNTISPSTTIPMWVVYIADPSGNIEIESVKSIYSAQFETKEEAIAHATRLNKEVIIKLTDNVNIRYTVKACCEKLDIFKELAQESGITDKVFSIKNTEL